MTSQLRVTFTRAVGEHVRSGVKFPTINFSKPTTVINARGCGISVAARSSCTRADQNLHVTVIRHYDNSRYPTNRGKKINWWFQRNNLVPSRTGDLELNSQSYLFQNYISPNCTDLQSYVVHDCQQSLFLSKYIILEDYRTRRKEK